MKRSNRQILPPGWTQKKVLAVIAHYDGQTEDEAADEIENSPEATGETWMSVPNELVGDITRLIEDRTKNAAASQTRKHKGPSKTRKAP